MINSALQASNSIYGREKLFWCDKINFSNHVCHCGAVDKELLASADKPGSTPGEAVSCFFALFLFFFLSCLVSLFLRLFSFWPFFLYSYCWPCRSFTWINIYFKLNSGVLFWKRDFKSSWSAYWPSLRPNKNHKLSRHVPPLKQLIFFLCWLWSWQTTHSTPQTVPIYTQYPRVTHWRKLNLPLVLRLNHKSPLGLPLKIN